MKGFTEEIYKNSLFLYYDYLPVYGVDKYNTKKSILLLHCLDELLRNNCHYEFIDERMMGVINKFYAYILNKNPQLKYCIKDNVLNYNNLGNHQDIKTYQVIKSNIE